MVGDSTRMVKMTYLLPVRFTNQTATATLPINILELSQYEVDVHIYLQ